MATVDLFELFRGQSGITEALAGLEPGERDRLVRDARAFVRRTLGGPAEDRIAFVRVPKCATTSIRTEILRAYRSMWSFDGQGIQSLHHRACDWAARARGESTWTIRMEMLRYYLAHPKTRYTGGHVAVDEGIMEQFGDDFSFITTLRHPVDRWISHYFYNKHRNPGEERYGISSGIENFLQTERGRGIGDLSTAYFSGTPDLDPEQRARDEVQRAARRNLKHFELVGFVERLPRFEREFGEIFSFDIDIGHRNTNPAPSGSSDVSDETRAKIREVCESDMRLYDWAREEFLA